MVNIVNNVVRVATVKKKKVAMEKLQSWLTIKIAANSVLLGYSL